MHSKVIDVHFHALWRFVICSDDRAEERAIHAVRALASELPVLLTSEWREEDKRAKRFYRLSPEGRRVLSQLLDEWRELNASLDRIV